MTFLMTMAFLLATSAFWAFLAMSHDAKSAAFAATFNA